MLDIYILHFSRSRFEFRHNCDSNLW